MQHVRNRLIYLHENELLTRRMLYKLLKYDKELRSLFTMSPSELGFFFSLSETKAMKLYTRLHTDSSYKSYHRQKSTYQRITIFDATYPKALRTIPDAPLVLYTLGNVALLNENPSISVIGTRTPSNEAYDKTLHFVRPLVNNGWVIVSGLAYGIDRMAHEITLMNHGKTIAILGSGFNHLYPKQHAALFEEIVKKGLVITEYPPNVPPRKYHFPERNRIISGLSLATLVIEAKEKSGTLITVDQALEQGKEVYAVPGSVLKQETVGCHKLIQEGAKLVIDAKDIEEDWNIFAR